MLGALADGDMEPAIDIERFAALSAEIDAGAQREELCAREGITVDAWTQTQEAWLSKMADETAQKRFALTNRYNVAFVERRRALTHGDRRGPSKRARPTAAAAPSVPPAAAPAPIAPPPIQVPSYEREMPPPMAAPPIAAPPMQTPSYGLADPAIPPPPPIASPPPMVAASATETAPIPPVPVPPPVAGPPPKAKKGATMAMPAFTDVAGAPLPFKAAPLGPPPGPPPPQASEPPPPRTPNDGSGTVTGTSPYASSKPATPFKGPSPSRIGDSTVAGAISPFAAGAPLPFQPSGAPPAPAPVTSGPKSVMPPAPAAVTPPAVVTPPAAVAPPAVVKPAAGPAPDATVFGAVSPFASGAAPLPFQPSAAAEPRPAGQQPGGALPFQQKPSPTSAPKQAAPAGAARPSPSVVATATATASRLTIEQFASLTAEIAVNPRGAAQIRARYGLDEASHAAEAEKYNRLFGADKALYDRYRELFQSYRDYVARAQR